MTINLSLQRLQDAWRESERHVHHLFHAMSALHPLWPFTAEKYAVLTDEQVRDLDQFILRISVKFAQRFVCPLSRFAGEGLGGGNGHDR